MEKIIIIVFFIALLACTGPPGLGVGENGVLNSGVDKTVVATSEEAFDQWIKAKRANDTHGTAQLIMAGKLYFMKSGTPVLVIDTSYATRKVRILDGKLQGMAGWVAVEHVK